MTALPRPNTELIQRTMRPRFTFSEGDCRDMLTGESGAGESAYEDDTTGDLFDARAIDEILRAALDSGVIGQPEGLTLAWESVDDLVAPGYRWLVEVDQGDVHLSGARLAGLYLASGVADPYMAGEDPDAAGIDAVVYLLREGVREANRLLDRLDAYVTPGPDPSRVLTDAESLDEIAALLAEPAYMGALTSEQGRRLVLLVQHTGRMI